MLQVHFLAIWAKEVHPSGSVIQAEKKGTSSVALQVPFWATWVGIEIFNLFICYLFYLFFCARSKFSPKTQKALITMFQLSNALRRNVQ